MSEDTHAWLAQELSEAKHAAFSAHLETCVTCREEITAARRLISALRSLPETEVETPFTNRIVAQARRTAKIAAIRRRWIRAAALTAALTLGAFAWISSEASPNLPPIPELATSATSAKRALDWLASAQERDGSWSTERWGGQPNFSPALTALPMLALVEGTGHSPEHAEGITRAAAHLITIQNADGSFGSNFLSAPYNHSIATFALLRAWQRTPESVPKPVLDRAIAFLASHQTSSGGWGLLASAHANRSITEWHVRALQLAAELGWSSVRSVATRGEEWLEADKRRVEQTDAPSVELQLGAPQEPQLDFHAAYFAAQSLRHFKVPGAQDQLTRLQNALIRRQVTSGAEFGSWSPDDQWGRAGGRIYATAMASLSLELSAESRL